MRQNLAFHIQKNDYFGTLATILDLIRQDLHQRGETRHAETLTELSGELVRMQHSCRIELLPEATEENSRLVA